jgi:CrcB protein
MPAASDSGAGAVQTPPDMFKLLLIAVGGAVGTLARYGTSTVLRPLSEGFPYGTLAVNLLGCLVIGFLQALLLERVLLREEYRIAILVGFLGGYTTFSTFGWETMSMLQDAQYWRASANLIANNVGGVVMVIAGYAIGVKL